MTTANATTNHLGSQITLRDVCQDDIFSESINRSALVWTEYKTNKKLSLGDIFSDDKYHKFDLLGRFIQNYEEGVTLSAEIRLYETKCTKGAARITVGDKIEFISFKRRITRKKLKGDL